MLPARFENRLTELLIGLRNDIIAEAHALLAELVEHDGARSSLHSVQRSTKSRPVSPGGTSMTPSSTNKKPNLQKTLSNLSTAQPIKCVVSEVSTHHNPFERPHTSTGFHHHTMGGHMMMDRVASGQLAPSLLAPPSRQVTPRASVESQICNPHFPMSGYMTPAGFPGYMTPHAPHMYGHHLSPHDHNLHIHHHALQQAFPSHPMSKSRGNTLDELIVPSTAPASQTNGLMSVSTGSHALTMSHPVHQPPAMPSAVLAPPTSPPSLHSASSSCSRLLPASRGSQESMTSEVMAMHDSEGRAGSKPSVRMEEDIASKSGSVEKEGSLGTNGFIMDAKRKHESLPLVSDESLFDVGHEEDSDPEVVPETPSGNPDGGFTASRYSEEIEDEDYKFIMLDVWRVQDRKSMRITGANSEMQFRFTNTEEDHDDEHKKRCCLEIVMSHFVVKQTSPQRICWDILGFILIAYDCIVLPLQFFELTETMFLIVMTWLVRIYWTLDFPFSFFTGYDNADCVTETRPARIAKRYMKTWLTFDLLIISFDWLEMAVDGLQNLAAARVGKVGKAVRLLRMARLMRVLRINRNVAMPEFVKMVSYKINSEKMSIILAMMRMIAFLIIVTHFIACAWYGIGNTESATSDAWVHRYEVDQERVSIEYAYATSFHWSLTQFAGSMDIQPQNSSERFFAVFALLFGFVVAAFVVSSITSSMTRLQIVMARQSTQVSMLNRFLYDNGISTKLALRVQRNAQYASMQEAKNTPEKDIELLSLVSEPLRVELHYEIHSPVLTWYPFFRHFNDQSSAALRRICHLAIDKLTLFLGDVLFSAGEMPHYPRMYFCVAGRLEYLHESMERSGAMPMGTWACEAVLWTHWAHRGTLRAKSEITLCTLDSKLFQDIALQFQTRENYAKRYAESYCSILNECRKNDLTDLRDNDVDWEHVCNQVFESSRFLSLRSQSADDTDFPLSRAKDKQAPSKHSTSPGRNHKSRGTIAKVSHFLHSAATHTLSNMSQFSVVGRSMTRDSMLSRFSQVEPTDGRDSRQCSAWKDTGSDPSTASKDVKQAKSGTSKSESPKHRG